MSNKIPKQKIYDACLHKQEELIKNFEERVAEMNADVYNQNQSASQSENRQAGKIDVLNTLDKELGFARMEMSYLQSLNPQKQNEKAEPGAVVTTNLRTFYIAVSSETIEADGQEIFGISTRAPLYHQMEGKQKGDSFEFNGTAYKIESIY